MANPTHFGIHQLITVSSECLDLLQAQYEIKKPIDHSINKYNYLLYLPVPEKKLYEPYPIENPPIYYPVSCFYHDTVQRYGETNVPKHLIPCMCNIYYGPRQIYY